MFSDVFFLSLSSQGGVSGVEPTQAEWVLKLSDCGGAGVQKWQDSLKSSPLFF